MGEPITKDYELVFNEPVTVTLQRKHLNGTLADVLEEARKIAIESPHPVNVYERVHIANLSKEVKTTFMEHQ